MIIIYGCRLSKIIKCKAKNGVTWQKLENLKDGLKKESLWGLFSIFYFKEAQNLSTSIKKKYHTADSQVVQP